jgi:hypothetical protein
LESTKVSAWFQPIKHEDCEIHQLRNQLKNHQKILVIWTAEILESEKPGCWQGFGHILRKSEY